MSEVLNFVHWMNILLVEMIFYFHPLFCLCGKSHCLKKKIFFFLKKQNYVVLHFWRLEVWNQGVDRAMLPWREISSLSLPAFDSLRLSSVCVSVTPIFASVFIWPAFFCVCLFPSYKDTGSTLIQYDLISNWKHLTLIPDKLKIIVPRS